MAHSGNLRPVSDGDGDLHGPASAGSGDSIDLRARLREDAANCVLAPGQRLKLEDLRARYNASVGSLREALMQLVSEGLVVAEVNRGFCVAPVSLADLEDITDMRADLERKSIDLAIAHGDDQWEADIVAAYHMLTKMSLTDAASNPSAWRERHNRFHEALVAACPSPWLLRFRGLLFVQSQRYRSLSLKHSPSPGRIDEHREMMDAVLRRDSAYAQELIETHVRGTADNVRLWLAEYQSK